MLDLFVVCVCRAIRDFWLHALPAPSLSHFPSPIPSRRPGSYQAFTVFDDIYRDSKHVLFTSGFVGAAV